MEGSCAHQIGTDGSVGYHYYYSLLLRWWQAALLQHGSLCGPWPSRFSPGSNGLHGGTRDRTYDMDGGVLPLIF